jgi:hypothetical protein
MKRLLLVVGMAVFTVIINGCGDANTTLDVSITQQPVGGYAITQVTCGFSSTMTTTGGGLFGNKEPMPITLSAEWWWEDGTHSNQQQMKSETFTFTLNETKSNSITYDSAPGYILLNYYFVKFKWTNEDGEVMTMESSKAYCQMTNGSCFAPYVKNFD